LNYTTTVAAEKTASEVLRLLVKGGARQVMSEYDDDGEVSRVAFAIDTAIGLRQFVLPIDVDAVHAALRRDRVARRYQTEAQARRVAWRIVKDWLEAQLAIIATGMVSLDQVMLGYMRVDTDRTLHDAFVDNALGELTP
jgi:hypothetical protein